MLHYSVQDATSVIIAVSKSQPGIAWEWFQREFQNENRIIQLEFHKIIGAVTGGFNDEPRLETFNLCAEHICELLHFFFYKNQ